MEPKEGMNVNNYQLKKLEVVVVGRWCTSCDCDIQTSLQTKTPRRRRKMLA